MINYDYTKHSLENENRTYFISDYCPPPINSLNVSRKGPLPRMVHPHLNGIPTYDWSPTTQGLILGSFFYGYIILQVPAGRIAEVLGGKWIVFIGVLGSGIINLMTPFLTNSIPILTTSRVFLGLIQGGVFPACFSLIVNWMPPNQRSLGFGLVNVGSNLGAVFAASLTGYICQDIGWPFSFFIIGGIATSWTIMCWMVLVRSRPSRQEIEESTGILKSNTDQSLCCAACASKANACSQTNQSMSVPWTKILTNKAVISAGMCRFVGIFGYLTLQTKLPAYLEDILHEPASTVSN